MTDNEQMRSDLEAAHKISNRIPFSESVLRTLYFVMLALEAVVLLGVLLGMYWFNHRATSFLPALEFWYTAFIVVMFLPVTARGYLLSAWNLKRVLAGKDVVKHSIVPIYNILYGWFNHVAVIMAGVVIPLVLAVTSMIGTGAMEWLFYVFFILPLFSMAQFLLHALDLIDRILPTQRQKQSKELNA